MNSDYQEVFDDRCPHIQVVFDYFHIRKNFNDRVVAAVRKDEQRRLLAEGRTEDAKKLKRTKYILSSNRSTLKEKDEASLKDRDAELEDRIFSGGKVKEVKGGNMDLYESLLKENGLILMMLTTTQFLTRVKIGGR